MAIPCGLEVGQDIRKLDLSVEQMLLLKLWQRTGRYATSDASWKVSGWGGEPGQWTESCRARVAADVPKVKHWTFAPLGSLSTPGYFMFDPPYLYNAYDYGTPFDHNGMAWELQHRVPEGSRIVACESVCRKTGAVPDYLPFEPSHTNVTMRRTYNEELIWAHGFGENWRENVGPTR